MRRRLLSAAPSSLSWSPAQLLCTRAASVERPAPAERTPRVPRVWNRPPADSPHHASRAAGRLRTQRGAGEGLLDADGAAAPQQLGTYALNNELVKASSTPEVLRLAAAHAHIVNQVNVSTAWHRLATLARKQPAAAPASAAQLAPLAALTLEWVGRLDARSCSNVLWALAVLSARAPAPAPDLLRPLLRASAEQAGRDSGYTPAAASATAWAAASLLADAPDDCAALVEAMLAESAAALPRCSAQSVANLLWAAATAAQLVPFSAAAPAAAQAAARLLLPAADARAFKPIELSCAAWALAELRYDPGPQAMSALDGSLAQLLGAEPALASVSAQSLVNIVWAFAVLNHSPRQTLELLRSSHLAAAAAAAALQASDVHLLLWSLAVMDQGEHIRSPIFAAAWAAASQVDGAACHPSHLAGLFQATLMEEADATARRLPPAQRPPPLPPPLMAAAEASWRAVVCQTRTSDLHEAIAATVAQLGLPTPLWIEKLTSDRLFSIDIALHFPPPGAAAPVEAAEPPPLASQGTLAEGPGGASGGMWVALEVDGPSHYTRNTQAPMGRSTYRNRLLASRGWRVVVLPFYRWNEMKTAEDRRELLRSLLLEAGVPASAFGNGRHA